ncbi:MAG: HesA/MoeB/ThiF family protein [Candidatus Pelagibacter sp.]|tara:strand:- start:215 stop:964 length:750 start_codon:yes stop_codon:yes gene_type:complete
MKKNLNKNSLIRYSRQIILKNIGTFGQKKILNSKVLIVGAGGLGCPVADLLARSGVGEIGIIDYDKVSLSNIHRQTLYTAKDINKYKVNVAKKRLNLINKDIKINTYNKKASEKNLNHVIKKYNIIVDGSDNFKTKFLINKFSLKLKKILIVGAISKFDGHIFTFDFNSKRSPCLKCFYQSEPSDDILNCETEGILGSTANIVGALQVNEILKKILNIGKDLKSNILILDFLNLNFRKVLFKKRKNCIC